MNIFTKKRIGKILFLDMGDSCNQACSYCRAECASMSEKQEHDIDKLEPVINHLIDMGFYLHITGGEPTLYKSTFELMDRLINKNRYFKLVTNGRNNHLLKKYVNKIEINVTCHYEVHNPDKIERIQNTYYDMMLTPSIIKEKWDILQEKYFINGLWKPKFIMGLFEGEVYDKESKIYNELYDFPEKPLKDKIRFVHIKADGKVSLDSMTFTFPDMSRTKKKLNNFQELMNFKEKDFPIEIWTRDLEKCLQEKYKGFPYAPSINPKKNGKIVGA